MRDEERGERWRERRLRERRELEGEERKKRKMATHQFPSQEHLHNIHTRYLCISEYVYL